MSDLVDNRRAHNKMKHLQEFPLGILDVIETDYPIQYYLMLEDRTRLATLFSDEEWIDILTKSRSSNAVQIKRVMHLSSKYLTNKL